jgi:glycosyltransferase involved in cell wall biosynthesis
LRPRSPGPAILCRELKVSSAARQYDRGSSTGIAERPPLVSVIMSMRNSAATVGSAVRSIKLQSLSDWELIVIDDGSSDDGAAIVEAFDDARIRLIRKPSRAGLAARLNEAVAVSRGTYVARMDADDVCFPDRLARQITELQQDPTLDLLGCGAVVFAGDARLLGELPVALTHGAITATPFRGFPFPHPTWCGRTEWFRSNPYDGRLMKTQDQELLLRTFRRSRFATLDEVLVGYRQDTLDLAKMLLGRRVFIGSLWRHARRSGEYAGALDGIATHLLKGGVDIATIGLGLNRLVQKNRLKPVRPATAKQWQSLQLQLGSSAGSN